MGTVTFRNKELHFARKRWKFVGAKWMKFGSYDKADIKNTFIAFKVLMEHI